MGYVDKVTYLHVSNKIYLEQRYREAIVGL